MANPLLLWNLLRAEIRARYTVERSTDDELVFVFTSDGLRRRVGVVCVTCTGEPWLIIAAPVSRDVSAHLEQALRIVTRSTVGTLALEGNRLCVRHAEPLAHVSFERLESLTREVAISALELNALARRARRSPSGTFLHFAE